jgi:hypothetical protein
MHGTQTKCTALNWDTMTPCSGVPWELKARDYAAQTLTAALGRPSTESESIPASAKGEEPTAGKGLWHL